MTIEGGHMTNTRDYIVFDRTGTPHAVVPIKVEIGGGTPPEPCPECGARLEKTEVEG